MALNTELTFKIAINATNLVGIATLAAGIHYHNDMALWAGVSLMLGRKSLDVLPGILNAFKK